ncbi:MAG: BlaI/MecI/CopY family transcriptional regulator [Sedimentisphaerales bacterium]|nr:BlaI/MecI/CopY family transcriptional regulator [Sedimentisphaerales bacterium]
MTKKTNALTEAEWQVIQVVWDNEPCAAPEVQEKLQHNRGWSYSTVKTMMDRMTTKGFLKTRRMRNLILYQSAIKKSEAQRREIMTTIKRAFNGALTPMMQFLLDNNQLSKKQIKQLEEMLKNKNAHQKKTETISSL